jgi:hypothetical protein
MKPILVSPGVNAKPTGLIELNAPENRRTALAQRSLEFLEILALLQACENRLRCRERGRLPGGKRLTG